MDKCCNFADLPIDRQREILHSVFRLGTAQEILMTSYPDLDFWIHTISQKASIDLDIMTDSEVTDCIKQIDEMYHLLISKNNNEN